jgi:hypothetical protein
VIERMLGLETPQADGSPPTGPGGDRPSLRARLVILTASLAATALIAYLAFVIGAWSFGFRRFSQHEGRLSRLLPQQPSLERVVQGLNDEGSRLIAAPETPAALERVLVQIGGRRAAEIRNKAARFPHTRVFLAGDMLYFIFFDEARVMRDFTCVSR